MVDRRLHGIGETFATDRTRAADPFRHLVLDRPWRKEQIRIHLRARRVCTPVLVNGVVRADLSSGYGQIPSLLD